MTRNLAAALLAGGLLFALSLPAAEAKPVRGTQTCEAKKVDHKIGDKNYSCTHCTNSICQENNGVLSGCGTEHTWKDCEEKKALIRQLLQTVPDLKLDSGTGGTKKLLPFAKPSDKVAPLTQ
jgi:hypothetical protein